MAKIGIRKEDKNIWERRVPLVPEQVAKLIAEEGLEIQVQSSAHRAFLDKAYTEAGALVGKDLPDAPVLFAVKEVPIQQTTTCPCCRSSWTWKPPSSTTRRSPMTRVAGSSFSAATPDWRA